MRINRPTISLTAVLLGSLLRGAAANAAAEKPLVVAVEVGPGIDVVPADVRQAVAAELGTKVMGAREPPGDGAADVLLVGLESGEIRMSLRAGGAVVSRTIASPRDRLGRLRSVGWLAGNMVRDQVGPIVATQATPAAPPVEAAAAIEPPPAAPAPPPLPPAPPAANVPPSAPSPPAVVASRPTAPAGAAARPVWSLAASGGPALTVAYDGARSDTSVMRGTAFEAVVQRQPSPDGMLLGLALTLGPDNPRHWVGLAAFAGSFWTGRSWFAEMTFGLGLESLESYATVGGSTGSAGEPPMIRYERVPAGTVPGLYLRGVGAGGLHLSREFDLVAQVRAHLSSNGDIGSYVSPMIGVRLRLP